VREVRAPDADREPVAEEVPDPDARRVACRVEHPHAGVGDGEEPCGRHPVHGHGLARDGARILQARVPDLVLETFTAFESHSNDSNVEIPRFSSVKDVIADALGR
jgi:hypothetical protein